MIKTFSDAINKSFISYWIYDRAPQSGPVDQGKIATLAIEQVLCLFDLNGRGLGFNSRPVHFIYYNIVTKICFFKFTIISQDTLAGEFCISDLADELPFFQSFLSKRCFFRKSVFALEFIVTHFHQSGFHAQSLLELVQVGAQAGWGVD
jgi:hypothetical protein